MAGELLLHLLGHMDRQMNRQHGTGRREGGQGLALGHARGPPRGACQHHRLAGTGQSQLGFQRRGCGTESGDTGRDGVGDVQFAQGAQLLTHGRPDAQVTGMQTGDIQPLFVCGLDFGHDVFQ